MDYKTSKYKKNISITALVVTALIWGFGYPIVYQLINNGVSSGWLNTIRFGFAFLSVLPFAINDLIKIKKREVLLSFVCGAILFLAFLFLTESLKYETPSGSALIVSLGIFVVPLLSWIFFKKRPKLIVFIGILVSFAGIIIFNLSGTLEFNMSIGTLFAFLSSILFGVHIFILDSYLGNDNVENINTMQLFFIFIFSLLFTLIFQFSSISFNFIQNNILYLLYVGMVCTGLTFFLQTFATKHLLANTINIILYLEALFAVVLSVILGFEKISVFFILGTIVTVVGVLIVTLKEKE